MIDFVGTQFACPQKETVDTLTNTHAVEVPGRPSTVKLDSSSAFLITQSDLARRCQPISCSGLGSRRSLPRKSSPAPARVTAQDFYDHDKCPHRVFLNRFGNPQEKLPHSDFLNMLFENALTHEHVVVEGLTYDMPKGATLQDRALSTLELMRSGAERIYQGVLLESNESGIPELLEKMPGKSNFGDYFYKPVDIKSGSGYADPANGSLRTRYGMQLCHYALLLQSAQGTFPPTCEILNRDRQRVAYPLDQFGSGYREALADIRLLVAGANPTSLPVPQSAALASGGRTVRRRWSSRVCLPASLELIGQRTRNRCRFYGVSRPANGSSRDVLIP